MFDFLYDFFLYSWLQQNIAWLTDWSKYKLFEDEKIEFNSSTSVCAFTSLKKSDIMMKEW